MRFALVGCACIGLNVLLFGLLVDRAGWNFALVTVIAFLLANALSFLLNRNWTFASRDGRVLRQIARFSAIQIGNLLVNLLLMWLLVGWLQLRAFVASIVISALLALGNFLAQRSWAFARDEVTA